VCAHGSGPVVVHAVEDADGVCLLGQLADLGFVGPSERDHHAPNAMDNFCLDVALGYRRLERPRRAQ